MGGVRGAGDCSKGPGDRGEHSVGVMQHIIVREPQHMQPTPAHIVVSDDISIFIDMRLAINLDD